MRRGATFDTSGQYRYTLWRHWSATRPKVTFVMLNPSTADHRVDDPTIRRCIDFARRWGFGSLHAVNLFAYRTVSPKILAQAVAPIGPRNDHYLRHAQRLAADVVVAWGVHGSLHGRDEQVLTLLTRRRDSRLLCLGTTKHGLPRQPLDLPATTCPQPWRALE